MQEKWKYIDERDGDFPEAYLLNDDGHKIKVELNREKKQVKITAEIENEDLPDTKILSSITNGIVMEELNLETGRKEDLHEEFKRLEKYLSGIPDSKVIRIIGGNYGVFSEITRTLSQHANQDIKLIKKAFRFIVHSPALLFGIFVVWLRDLIQRPSLSDFLDALLITGLGYGSYLLNFNYAFGGLVMVTGAVTSGYADWILRKRDPYVFKILVILVPAVYFIGFGLKYQ